MTVLEKLQEIERIRTNPDRAAVCSDNPDLARVLERLESMQEASPDAVEEVREILRDIEDLDLEQLGSGYAATPRNGDWGLFFRTAKSLKLEGPSDWSERFEEYLYGDRS